MVTVSSELWQAGTTPEGQRCLHSSQDKPAIRVASLRAGPCPSCWTKEDSAMSTTWGQGCWWNDTMTASELAFPGHFHPLPRLISRGGVVMELV